MSAAYFFFPFLKKHKCPSILLTKSNNEEQYIEEIAYRMLLLNWKCIRKYIFCVSCFSFHFIVRRKKGYQIKVNTAPKTVICQFWIYGTLILNTGTSPKVYSRYLYRVMPSIKQTRQTTASYDTTQPPFSKPTILQLLHFPSHKFLLCNTLAVHQK